VPCDICRDTHRPAAAEPEEEHRDNKGEHDSKDYLASCGSSHLTLHRALG